MKLSEIFVRSMTHDKTYRFVGETPSNIDLRAKIQDAIKCQQRASDSKGRVYFVCTDFDMDWIELPPGTSEEIVQSRKLQKFCRGNLEANVRSHPPFPGTEKNYLVALIARITHGTYINPIDTEEKDLSFENMFDLAKWVHSQSEISGDGSNGQMVQIVSTKSDSELSITRVNDKPMMAENGEIIRPRASVANKNTSRVSIGKSRPSTTRGSDNNAPDDVISNSETESIIQSETIAPKTCADDYFDGRIRPWNIASVDNYCIPDAIVLAESVIWKGAFAMATRGIIDHIYFGWGQKMTMHSIVPSIHFCPENEYAMSDVECQTPKCESKDALSDEYLLK